MPTTLQSLSMNPMTPEKMSPNLQANQLTPSDENENAADLFHKLQLIRNENRKRWSENVQRESAAMIQDMLRDFNDETVDERRDDDCAEKRRVPLKSLTNTTREKEMKNCKPFSTLTITPPDSLINSPTSPSTPKHSPNQPIGIAKPMYETTDNYMYDPSTLFNFTFQSQAGAAITAQESGDCQTSSPCGSSCLSYFDDRLSVIQECDEEMSVEEESFESMQDIVRAQGEEEEKCRDDTESESNDTDITLHSEEDVESIQDICVESDDERETIRDGDNMLKGNENVSNDTDATLENENTERVSLPRALGPLLRSSERHYSIPIVSEEMMYEEEHHVSETMYEEEYQQQFCTEGCFFINGLTKLFVGKRNQDCLVKGC